MSELLKLLSRALNKIGVNISFGSGAESEEIDKPAEDITFVDVDGNKYHEELLHNITSSDVIHLSYMGSSYATPEQNQSDIETVNDGLKMVLGMGGEGKVYLYQSTYPLLEASENFSLYHKSNGELYKGTEMFKLAEAIVEQRLMEDGKLVENPASRMRLNILSESYGSISAKQLEMSLIDVMRDKGYGDEQIKEALSQVCVIAIGDVSMIGKSTDGISFNYMSVIAKNDGWGRQAEYDHNKPPGIIDNVFSLVDSSPENTLYKVNGNTASSMLLIGPDDDNKKDELHHNYLSYWRAKNSLFPEAVKDFAKYIFGNDQINPQEIQKLLNPISIELKPENDVGQSTEHSFVPDHILQSDVSVASPLPSGAKEYQVSKGIHAA